MIILFIIDVFPGKTSINLLLFALLIFFYRLLVVIGTVVFL